MNAVFRPAQGPHLLWSKRLDHVVKFSDFNFFGIGFAFVSSAGLWYAIIEVATA
jgi:hypothetical protein